MHSILRLLVLTAALAVTTASASAKTVTPPGIPTAKELPPSLTVLAGAKVTLSITANGTTPLSYQWQKVGTGNISGATKSTYTITSVTGGNAGTYQVVVSNSAGHFISNSTLLTVNTNYAGKYNMAVLSYNATEVANNGNQTSGDALYGTTTVSSGPSFGITTTLSGYLGENTGASQKLTGFVSSNGAITINGTDSNLNINMVMLNGTVIGFLGTGTPKMGTDNSDDSYIIGLNATTTAPKSAALCQGNYAMMVISYNATAVSKKSVAENNGDAQLGLATVTSGGAFSTNQTLYATGGNDTLGNTQTVSGTVSSSGAISNVVVQTGHGPQNHPISVKFVTLNGQVIGFTGTFKPVPGNQEESNSGILIGIKNTSVAPLSAPPTP